MKGGGRDSNSVVLDPQGRLAAAYDARNCAQLLKCEPIGTRTVSMSSHSKKIMHNSTFSEYSRKEGVGVYAGGHKFTLRM